MGRFDAIGIEFPCIDFLAHIGRLPKSNEGTQIQETSWQGGGKVSTGLVATARLGAKCAFIGHVGSDMYGIFCKKDFEKHGIDTTRLIVDDGKVTSFSIVLSDDETHGRSILYRPGNVDSIRLEDTDFKMIEQSKYIHLTGSGGFFTKLQSLQNLMG